MNRTRFRHLAGYIFSFVLALSAATGCAATTRYDDTYFVRQEIGPVSGDALITQQMLIPVTLQSDGKGSRLDARTVWFRLDAGQGQRGDSYALDARYPDDAALAAFLASGIETRLDDKGQVVSVGAADPQALETLARQRPEARDALARIGDAVGVRPFVLPKHLRVGQRLGETQKVPGLGELAWTMRVATLDAQQVELEMQATSPDGASLTGYQVLRRDSGLPVEVQLTLSLPDGLVPGQSEPMQLRMLAISQRHAPSMSAIQWDEADWKRYRESFAQLQASPEFRGEAVSVDELQDLDTHLKQQWITRRSPAEWERIRNGLIFAIDDKSMARPEIRLSGQYDMVGPGQWPQAFLMRLKNARLLDANNKPLAGIAAVPNRLFELTAGRAELGLKERDEEFPFRLPPALPATALDGLDAIALDLELGEYALQGSTVIAQGKQAGPSSPTLDWSQRWVELKQTDATDSEVWILSPLDAQGRPIRHVAIPYRDRMLRPLSENLLPPLSSQHGTARYRVVTTEPIAAVELRHYTLQWQPTVWIFDNVADMLAGGALVGVRHAAELVGVPASAVSGQALLEAFDMPVDDESSNKVQLRLHGDLQEVAARFCEVQLLSPTAEPLPAYEWERHSGNDLFGFGEPAWVGWSVHRHALRYALGDDPVAVQAICPKRIEPVVERVGKGSCFQNLDNGYVGIAATCKADVANARQQKILVARDASGQRLAELSEVTEDITEDRMRFFGLVDTIEYVRVDAATLSRELPLPAR